MKIVAHQRPGRTEILLRNFGRPGEDDVAVVRQFRRRLDGIDDPAHLLDDGLGKEDRNIGKQVRPRLYESFVEAGIAGLVIQRRRKAAARSRVMQKQFRLSRADVDRPASVMLTSLSTFMSLPHLFVGFYPEGRAAAACRVN